MTFSKVGDEEYTQPKDKLPLKNVDRRKYQYYIDPGRRRFVYLNKEAADHFDHPGILEEFRWKQENYEIRDI